MRKLWTASEIEYLKENYSDKNTAVICAHLDRSLSSVFGMVYILQLHKSETFRNSPLSGRLRPGSHIGGATRFKSGITPINKGKKQSDFMSKDAIERTKATRFQKGLKPHNTKKNGEISIRRSKGRPYQYIRIAENHWRELHLVVWEKEKGPVPSGFNVQFKDKNSLNCTIENLYLINRKDQMVDNSVQRYPQEVRTTMQALGKFKRKIKKYEEQD
jgi:hypothetical protein